MKSSLKQQRIDIKLFQIADATPGLDLRRAMWAKMFLRGEKPPNNRLPSWIYRENIRFPVHAHMLPIQKKNPNSQTPPTNVHETRPNVPIRHKLYPVSI